MQLSNKKGFTVVELMISITVFTIAILLVTSAVIYIGKQYQKGVSQAQLQDTARTIHQNITDAIKLNGAGINNFTPQTDSSGFSFICLDNATYYFPTVASTGVVSSAVYNTMPTNLFVEYKPNSCTFNKSASVALLPDNAKVTKFSITDSGNGVWEVSTNFIIADEDLADIPTSGGGIVKCKTNVAGREFCAQTNITSYASKRVN